MKDYRVNENDLEIVHLACLTLNAFAGGSISQSEMKPYLGERFAVGTS